MDRRHLPCLLLILLAPALSGEERVAFRAGFAEVEITPPLGTPKQGWNTKLVADSVLDPLYARAAVFEAGGDAVVFIQLDLASISAADTAAIRSRIERDHGVLPGKVMVAATHNHSGPAVVDEALPRSEDWVRSMIEKASSAAGRALEARADAEAGLGSVFEWEVAFNRRVLMRDGTARTHGSFKDPAALAFEGPIDPEVAVFAARGRDGKMLGALVSFSCHPTHHGGDGVLSAGFPGVVARILKTNGVPVTLYLQGAAGNMHHNDPRGFPEKDLEAIGAKLSGDAMLALGKIEWRTPALISTRTKKLALPYREPMEDEIRGTNKGAQRFGEAGYYDQKIPKLLEIARERRTEEGEVQVFRIGDIAFAAQPSESFVEHGLRIKEATWPVRTVVVGYANGMLGYIPTREAFRRGGYETTFGPPSCMAPDVGDRLADAAIDLVRELWR
jgi:hypothetical protein